ncbi:MAG TPA: hypothetical protein VEC35_17125 [Noviherbaspirillum sp.]|nr:hypothetical protein [Noviherbaspirillum sp.]
MIPATLPLVRHAHSRRVSIHSDIKARQGHLSNLWVFDSPKINRRFTVHGDVNFMHLVLLEGDVNVVSYDPAPQPVFADIENDKVQTFLDAIVYFRDGHEEWWEFKRAADAGPTRRGRAKRQLSAQAQAAGAAGKKYVIKTERDLEGRSYEFDNWLHLCAMITRARGIAHFKESELLRQRLCAHDYANVGMLLQEPNIDSGLMLSAIASALQQGHAYAELQCELLGTHTTLRRRQA